MAARVLTDSFESCGLAYQSSLDGSVFVFREATLSMQIAELKQQFILTDGIVGIFAIPSSQFQCDDNEHTDRNDD